MCGEVEMNYALIVVVMDGVRVPVAEFA